MCAVKKSNPAAPAKRSAKKPAAPHARRQYKSPVREQQSQETRARIVDAIVAQLTARGLSDFSVAEIAQRAGVSERTVFRYFPTRDHLLRAVEENHLRTLHPEGPPVIDDLALLVEWIPASFRRFDENKEMIEATLVSGLGRSYDEWSRRRRVDYTLDMVRPLVPHLDADELRRRVYLLRNLFGYTGWRFLTRDCGLDNEDAIRATEWAVKLLVDDTIAADERARRRRR